jgi:hypothetical protein
MVQPRKKLTLLLTVLIATLSGTAARAEATPGWVSGNSTDYPQAAYLTGVGEGPTQERAADKARGEIAKIFGLEIRAETQSSAREVSDGKKSTFSQDVSDDVRTFTAKVIDGIEIARDWRDESGTHYALAVLDRAHSLKVVGDKIGANDKEFTELYERLGKTEGKFSRIRTALRLVALGKSRRRFNSDYRFLNPEGKGIEAPAASAEALASARKAVSAVTVQVDVQGTNAARVQTRFIDALSVYGLRATEKGGRAPDILVEAVGEGRNLRAENLTWFNAEGSLSVKMSYGSTGEVITSFEESGTGSSGDPRTAVGKTLATLSTKATARVFKILVSGDLLDD